ncbi:MAG: hypothetical protein FJ297_01250 [Planctomycetes bacterium]|nr:hypothetical protein [Planctomycetota bacterium]
MANPPIGARRRSRSVTGVTILELLIAMTVSLVVVYAMIGQFNVVVTQVAEGRSSVELSGQLRGSTTILQSDLRGVTAPARTSMASDAGLGYFEYGEGLGHDTGPLAVFTAGAWTDPPVADTSFGDFDDYLAFTSHSVKYPFVGQYAGATIDSHHAEVVWWTYWNDADADGQPRPGELMLHRRPLLVRPDLGVVFDLTSSNLLTMWDSLKTFYDTNDVSTHPVVTWSGGNMRVQLWANSMADLTRRENRFCHHPILALNRTNNTVVALNPHYPFDIQRNDVALNTGALPALNTAIQVGTQTGEDVIQANLLAFDVKAYDPHVPLLASQSGQDVLHPSDPGYGRPGPSGLNETPISMGGFVDLYYMRYVLPRMSGFPTWAVQPLTSVYGTGLTSEYASRFSGPPAFHDLNGNALWGIANEPFQGSAFPVYDTWSFHYEQDGIDQDRAVNRADGVDLPSLAATYAWRGTVDQGMDGLDNDGIQGVDNPSERETQPPYAAPLRGIRVEIRVIEADARNVKQLGISHDFTPE